MWWFALWTGIAAFGAVAMLASANSVRFARRVSSEMEALRSAGSAPPLDLRRTVDLPAPVRRYLDAALGTRTSAIRTASLRHAGSFRPSLHGAWLPIEGRQRFTADPPGFIWWGRVRAAPGIWIDARDRSVHGEGNMLVSAESTFTIANARGPELDQSALLRLLGELVWLPTAFLDERYVRWTAVDDRRAAATLSVGGYRVSGAFEFGTDGMPAVFRAERHRDIGGGRSVLTPFIGWTSDYRRVDGVLVPHRVVGAWIIEGQPFEYARFDARRIAIDDSPTHAEEFESRAVAG
jgi:hypothetical protein